MPPKMWRAAAAEAKAALDQTDYHIIKAIEERDRAALIAEGYITQELVDKREQAREIIRADRGEIPPE